MSEDFKFIVTELNNILKKNYTLLSFKALNSGDLLQVLSDVLAEITQDGPRVDLRDESLEQTSIRLLSILRVLKYQPDKDPTLFRQRLVKGDSETIYTILQWLLSKVEVVRQRAYLARFLVKVEVPQEYLTDPETMALYERYLSLVEEFKMVHKEREAGKKGGEAAAELKADLKAMEKEREVIVSRIEKIKLRTESSRNLLKAAHSLRLERERERELSLQKITEKEAISNLEGSLQRAERELEFVRKAGGGELTAKSLIERLSEEVMVLSAIQKERLPSELSNLKLRVGVLSEVAGSPYVAPDEIVTLRQRLDVVARQVQALAETRVAESGADKMAPFRQQAAAISSVKRNTLEKLEAAESLLAQLTAKLEEKRERAKRFAEDSLPRGEELKRYVARLKSKSVLYKRCRAELAALRAENGLLSRTLVILDSQMVHSPNQSERFDRSKSDLIRNESFAIPDDFTAENAASINARLTAKISSLRNQLTPLLNELQPLRQKSQEVEERYERARNSHRSVEASVRSKNANIVAEFEALKQSVTQDTAEAERLRQEIEKLKLAQSKIQQEIKSYASPNGGQSLREKLKQEISAEEKQLQTLKDEEKSVKIHIAQNANQTEWWTELITIFECKLKYAEENKERDGIVVRQAGAETLILE
ncbi:intraflagellar transport protein 81 homolog [Venturia canescens]|uniref:intraflagellar transport protein 81 homolog n=1 Tax=Venturia canescens TaxID=32260 RepID=UPI001C9C229E|nr:intraflagellar transport protein 81 homolog [Venturia canescens]